jgi:hypothetical protein
VDGGWGRCGRRRFGHGPSLAPPLT